MNRAMCLCLSVILILSVLFAPVAAEDGKAVKIVCDPWPPWMEGKEAQKPTGGIFIRITEAVFERAGLKYEMKLYPFKRCIYHMESGKSDVMLMVSKTPEREKFMMFSETVLSDPYFLYYNPERITSFEWNTWKDLKKYRIGVVSGFNYGKDFKDAIAKYGIKTEGVTKDIQNVKKLAAGRFELIILNKTNAERIVRQHPEFKVKIRASEKVLHESRYPFGFSKKSPFVSHIPIINNAVGEIQKDGTLEKILEEYESSD